MTTSNGLRISRVDDTFDEAAYAQWAKDCHLPSEMHQRWSAPAHDQRRK